MRELTDEEIEAVSGGGVCRDYTALELIEMRAVAIAVTFAKILFG